MRADPLRRHNTGDLTQVNVTPRGRAISNSIPARSGAGVLAALEMVLHEFPEGIITYVLLTRSGFTDRQALVLSLAAASLSTPAGMIVSWP